MKDDDDIMCYRSELEAAVKAAVEAEREACAKVCDEYEWAIGRNLYTAPPQREKQEPTGPLVNIELSRRMAAVKVNNFYGSIIKDAEKEIERLHGLVLQHTAPPQRQWVGLTDEDRQACAQSPFVWENYLAIEAKLKEKNHG